MIDGLMKQRKRKVQDLEDINKGIPMEEIMRQREEQRMEDLRERVMKQLVDKGVELDAITTEMIDEQVNRLQQKQEDFESQQDPGQVMVFADVECLLDSTNTFVPILISYAIDNEDIIFHYWGTNCIQTFIQTMMDWSNQDNKEEDTKELHICFHN